MSENFDEVLKAALALAPGTRARLADHLLASLDLEEQKRIDAIWAEEAERRLQEVRDGKLQPIDGERVMKELRAKRLSDRELTLKDRLTGLSEKPKTE